MTFQVLAADFAPHWWRDWIDRAMAANRQGAWLVPQVAGKPASVLVGFESSFHPFVRNPVYRQYADLPFDERIAKLSDPERARRGARRARAMSRHAASTR